MNNREVVGEFTSVHSSEARQKDIAGKKSESVDIQTNSALIIWSYVSSRIVPLKPGFVLPRGAELMIQRGLNCMIQEMAFLAT